MVDCVVRPGVAISFSNSRTLWLPICCAGFWQYPEGANSLERLSRWGLELPEAVWIYAKCMVKPEQLDRSKRFVRDHLTLLDPTLEKDSATV